MPGTAGGMQRSMVRVVYFATSAGEAAGASRPAAQLGGRGRGTMRARMCAGAVEGKSWGCTADHKDPHICRDSHRGDARGHNVALAAACCRSQPKPTGQDHVGLEQDTLQHDVVLVQQAEHVAAAGRSARLVGA